MVSEMLKSTPQKNLYSKKKKKDPYGLPSLRIIFMLISWFGLKRNPNKVVIIWTVTLLLPFMLPSLKCLSPLVPINCLQHHPNI